ncbi:MAG TPA: Rieske (2Fe-2S) protein [Myxococcota bacterium]|nr:Rieske (2Fe-2S) protein [Myxococcota bacterium]HRY95160.1 Rieske (2Fe-2S) protein [Myxococcota bacterium]HSA20919.1 Rieske (2Fe-2S) protein [Myxococcota bacterium]
MDDKPAAPAPPSADAGAGSPRREFLARLGAWVAGGAGLAALAGAVRFVSTDVRAGPAARFALGLAADFKIRTLTWLRRRDLFVLHDDGGFGAFSARCTHLGCTVQRTAEGFRCPCHGARFDPLGQPISGPARRPLPWFRVWLEPDGRLWVDTSRPVEGGTRPAAELSAVPTPDGGRA